MIKQRLKGIRDLVSPPPGVIAKRRIAKYLPVDPVIVEAGAHIGRDTVEMAHHWPRGVIHAFEPVPSVYRQLQQHTRKLANVKLYPQALGAEVGQQEM
jgi:hypothetical protein